MQYNSYAATYDRTGQIQFSVLMNMYLRDLLRAHPVAGTRLLELACGTGTLALMMAERGWQVLGLDRSTAMLEQARAKQAAVPEPLALEFAEGDMRDFAVAAPVDLVTCCFDTLNYLLTEDQLLRCFGAVARALAPGGCFMFDVATDFFLRHYWQGVEFEEWAGVSQAMQSHYDAATGYSTLVLTGFVSTSRGRFRRFREVHIERAYPDATIQRLLRAAGLVVEAVYDCFTTEPPNERSLRLMYVARRPGPRA